MFPKSYDIKLKSDCIYHAPIDLEQQTDVSVGVPNQSENGKYNLISGWFNKISKRFLCVCPEFALRSSHREVDPAAAEFKPNLDCSCTFPIYLAPNGIPFDAKSIGKVQLQPCFGLN